MITCRLPSFHGMCGWGTCTLCCMRLMLPIEERDLKQLFLREYALNYNMTAFELIASTLLVVLTTVLIIVALALVEYTVGCSQ